MKNSLESSLEKIGRILARQYNIEVVFEGNQAKTDGKKIYLPNFPEISEELGADLNAYLDHEVAHCKFTNFPVMKGCKTGFHANLLNATEDVRIEAEMIKEYPGTKFHLDALNSKLTKNIYKARAKGHYPYPVRIIFDVRDIMLGKTPVVEDDIKQYIDLIREDAVSLRDCKSTEDIFRVTEIICNKISGAVEKQKQQQKPEQSEPESSEPKKNKSKLSQSEQDSMVRDSVQSSKDKFDRYTMDVHSMIDKSIKQSEKENKQKYKLGFSKKPYVPATTRFDKITDHSGKGNQSEYLELKKQISKIVSPIRNAFEKSLKVKENSRWHLEKERGSVSGRTMYRTFTDPSYNRIFKSLTKQETKDVAVSILIDLSLSMKGDKLQIAKQAAIAMGEALKSLDIQFEVLGFSSVYNAELHRLSKLNRWSWKSFARSTEALDLRVFKSFETTSMNGITNLRTGQENPDGECLAWAAKRLTTRKEKRKILIVLSDGQPYTQDTDTGILCNDLKNRIAKIKKSGIECVGIGILTDYVREYYPEHVIISNLEELPQQALKKITTMLLRAVA